MSEFKLTKKPQKVLKLVIGDDTFSIPLAESLTPEEAAPLDTQKGTIDYFRKYLSDEVKAVLTIADYNEITKAWVQASKDAGNNPGE